MGTKELDKLWSERVRERFNSICPHCGYSPDTGQSAHIFGRMNQKTRHVVENGIWACQTLHRMMEEGEEKKKKVVEFYVDNFFLYEKLEKIAMGKGTAEEFNFTDLKNGE